MKKKIIFIIIGALIIIYAFYLLLSAKGKVSDNNVILENVEKVENVKIDKVNVSEVTRSVFYAPQYVAISQGFFKDNNIEIDLITGEGADSVMTSVLSGQVDIGFAGPEASIYVYNEGKEDYTQVFAQLTRTDGSFLVAKEDTDNFNWTDLKGKKIIPGRKGGVPYITLEYVIRKNGLDPQKDLKLDDSIKFDLMAGAFTSGDADYVTLFEPTASMTELQGKGYVVASVGKEAGEIPYTAYFAKKSYIDEHSDLIQRFTNAIYHGEQWVKDHPAEETAEIIKDFFPDSNLDVLTAAVQSYKDIEAWNETPVLKKEGFDRLQEVMKTAGELETEAPYDKIINNTFAEKVK